MLHSPIDNNQINTEVSWKKLGQLVPNDWPKFQEQSAEIFEVWFLIHSIISPPLQIQLQTSKQNIM